MHARKTKTALFATLTVVVSVLLCFVFLEYVAAYFLYPETQERVDKEFDPVLGWRYRTGTYRVKPDNSFIAHTIRINALGLRDDDRVPASGKHRVIVLGDSFTFARWVRREDMFTHQLERMLNDRSHGRYEVVNAGVEGYGNAQQLLMLNTLAEAGIVGETYVLQVFTNDILDNLRLDYDSLSLNPFQPGYVVDPMGKLRVEHVPQGDTWRAEVTEARASLQIVKVLSMAAESYVQSRPGLVKLAADIGIPVSFPRMPGLMEGWYNEEIAGRGVPLMKELIRAIQSEVGRRQAAFLVVFIPSPLMVYPDTYGPILRRSFPGNARVDLFVTDVERPAREIRELCRQLDVPFLDLYPVLLNHKAKALYFAREGHLQAEGHRIVAEAIADKLLGMQRH